MSRIIIGLGKWQHFKRSNYQPILILILVFNFLLFMPKNNGQNYILRNAYYNFKIIVFVVSFLKYISCDSIIVRLKPGYLKFKLYPVTKITTWVFFVKLCLLRDCYKNFKTLILDLFTSYKYFQTSKRCFSNCRFAYISIEMKWNHIVLIVIYLFT